jgi:hypothetical protein
MPTRRELKMTDAISAMEYWLGKTILVVLGFIGFAFRQKQGR